MSRIRSIHPGLWTDEAFVQLSDAAQVLLIGLWTEADDQGVFEWKPLTLKLRLRGASNTSIEPMLAEMVALDCIRQFQFGERQYGAIRNFCRFQRPKKPNAIHPMPGEIRIYVGTKSEPSSEPVPNFEISTQHEEASVPTIAEIAPQMEEEGGREGGRKKERPLATLAPSADAERDRDFEAFWKAYPRKVGKGQARRAYSAACRKTAPVAILDAVSHTAFNPDPRFQPHPATWLNGERWLDDTSQFDPVLRAAGLRPEDFEDQRSAFAGLLQ